MEHVATDLSIWRRSLLGKIRLKLHIANEVILRLDVAQENRTLSSAEIDLRKLLKQRVIGLAAIERARKRQASRITWLKAGDASTKFFHAKVCARKRKNYIHAIQDGDRVLTSHHEKEAAIHDHFSNILGAIPAR